MGFLKRFIKYGIALVALLLLLLSCLVHYKHDTFQDYFFSKQSVNSKRSFLVQSLNVVPVATDEKTALFLGGTVLEDDIILPIQKNYYTVVQEEPFFGFQIFLHGEMREKCRVIQGFKLEDVSDFDLVIASFCLPFYSPEYFKDIWQYIDGKIKVGAYFIGNFFDPSTSIFNAKERNGMTFHTKEEVLEIFKNYKILKLAEVKKEYSNGLRNGIEYYYEVFVQKVR